MFGKKKPIYPNAQAVYLVHFIYSIKSEEKIDSDAGWQDESEVDLSFYKNRYITISPFIGMHVTSFDQIITVTDVIYNLDDRGWHKVSCYLQERVAPRAELEREREKIEQLARTEGWETEPLSHWGNA